MSSGACFVLILDFWGLRPFGPGRQICAQVFEDGIRPCRLCDFRLGFRSRPLAKHLGFHGRGISHILAMNRALRFLKGPICLS